FSCGVLGRTLVWHKGSSAFDRSGRQLQRYFDTRNLWHLLRRHTGHVSRSRRLTPSAWHYLRYAFYRYEIEMEKAKPQGADAVVDGFVDAVRGQFGPYRAGARRGVSAARLLFRSGHRLARGRAESPVKKRGR